MLPGFIDGHSHFVSGAMTALSVSLAAPPIGEVTSIEDIKRIMKAEIKKRNLKKGKTLIGMSYDDALFKEQRNLTKDDLDEISTEHAILLAHQSMHVGCVNSYVLNKYNINDETKNTEGGIIGRYENTNTPNGQLEENDFLNIFMKAFGIPKLTDIPKMFKAANKLYASNGITTAQEGAITGPLTPLCNIAKLFGWYSIDVVGYLRCTEIEHFLKLDKMKKNMQYKKHFRIGGAKFFLDGSPQAKTAWLTKPYHIAPKGQNDDYCGYPIYEDDEFVKNIYKEAIKRDIQILTHCNGDKASDQLINCYEQARKELNHTKDLRPVMIHSQTVREDQLDKMKEIGILPSFFHDHTFFWGDWHRDSVLGEERARRISPLKSALDRNINFTLHQDSPVVPPNMIFSLWCAVNRKTRTGKTLGKEYAITIEEALKAITINSAYQHFEEDTKGSITVGKIADLVILDKNPTTIESDLIKDIKVLETIKDGNTVYKR